MTGKTKDVLPCISETCRVLRVDFGPLKGVQKEECDETMAKERDRVRRQG